MFKSKFQIEDGPIYEGYTKGNHWNGWACPWFTKETALEIADAHNALMNEFNALLPNNKSYAIYNETEDTFIFYGYDEAETEEFKGKDFTINGKTLHLYPIGNGCWIGANATILGGVTIGDGAVVAAGAVVTQNVDANTLVGGVPCKVIRSLI